MNLSRQFGKWGTTSVPLLPLPLGWRESRELGLCQGPSGREPKDRKNSRQAAFLTRAFGQRTGPDSVPAPLWVFLRYDNPVSEI